MSKLAKNSLSGMTVGRAMRNQLNLLPQETPISSAINSLIKYKINGLLTHDGDGNPAGVLSKTDIMGAYYADIPIDAPLEYIMSRPPLFCHVEDPLENALEQMRGAGVYRLYVKDNDDDSVIGALAYPDIVGLLYKYCGTCAYSHFKQIKGDRPDVIKRSLVGESMTTEVRAVRESAELVGVMEELSTHKMGALLVRDQHDNPVGVISKTDLILAYKHGVGSKSLAETIMSRPVRSCKADDLLEDAIRTMIFSDLHRLFVSDDSAGSIVGVFTLTDAARSKSGSCHACISSRITI